MRARRVTGIDAIPAATGLWQIGLLSRLRLPDYLELTKPRVTTLVLTSTLVGFYVGTTGRVDFWLLLHTLVGTGLAAAGSATLNQFLERTPDKLMKRTENRPLPSERLKPKSALVFGIALSLCGTAYLAIQVNFLSSLLALAVLASYLFLYTPLKQKTSLCTLIGAFPGAAPPVIGWTAATGMLDLRAASLFLILFLWQFPHFFAIAWMYREDYKRAGFQMLPLQDNRGIVTGQQILIYTMSLIPVSLLPSLLGMTRLVYLGGAVALGLLFLYYAFRAAHDRTPAAARLLLKASVIYLPLLLALMVLDKA